MIFIKNFFLDFFIFSFVFSTPFASAEKTSAVFSLRKLCSVANLSIECRHVCLE